MQLVDSRKRRRNGWGWDVRLARIEAALASVEARRSAARFLLVGALGTLIDFSLFALLSAQIAAPTMIANTLAYSAGILNNYFWHRNWTYGHRRRKAAGRQFAQFAGVSLSALALNNLLVFLLAPPFSSLLASPVLGALAAKIFATGAGMGWNFLANHLWTFRVAAR